MSECFNCGKERNDLADKKIFMLLDEIDRLKQIMSNVADEIETYITLHNETNLNLKYAMDDLRKELK